MSHSGLPYVQEVVNHFIYLLYKMGHYFLDTQYNSDLEPSLLRGVIFIVLHRLVADTSDRSCAPLANSILLNTALKYIYIYIFLIKVRLDLEVYIYPT